MDERTRRRIGGAVGAAPAAVTPLQGGCVGEVYLVRLADGGAVVAKAGRAGASEAEDMGGAGSLDIEGFMLRLLAERSGLPVPRVLLAEPDLLVMEHLPGESRFDERAERHAAEFVAALHSVTSPNGRFGLERDTLIGSLHQPNGWMNSWVEFYRTRRLESMAEEAARSGRLPGSLRKRVGSLAARLGEMIDEPAAPSLLHGDIWTTNVLAMNGRITGFIDPAVYYGHAEIELAFITLFSTFGRAFFSEYAERRPIAPGFFEARRHVYNLYPLLVHVRLFGGGYVGSVDETLERLGL